jgi:dTDP-glucose 4,6-dehydratase
MTNQKNILITGGAGFIGANFIHYWLKHHPEDKIINLDALTYAGNLNNLESISSQPNYRFVKGDIRDRDLVNQLMADVKLVVHFAAETHVDRSITNPQVFLETNVLGTQVLIESALKNKVEHFHHISTDEVFGSLELDSQTKFTETTAYDPHSPYSASKAASDHLVRAYGDTYGLPFTISNCSNNYGPRQFPEKLFPLAITNLLEDKPVPIYGDGLNVRDWLFVDDHCRAIELIIESKRFGETFLIGGLSQDISNLEIAKLILKLMDKTEQDLRFVNDRPGHDRRYAVDWSKIKRELGWQPSVTLEEGLRRTITWYKENTTWWQELKQKNQDWFTTQYE